MDSEDTTIKDKIPVDRIAGSYRSLDAGYVGGRQTTNGDPLPKEPVHQATNAHQRRAQAFFNKYPHPKSALNSMLYVVQEAAEVSKEFQRASGGMTAPVRLTPELVDECGDLYFSVLDLFNQLGFDANQLLEQAIAKYTDRVEHHGHMGSRK